MNTGARLRSGTVPVPKLWCEHGHRSTVCVSGFGKAYKNITKGGLQVSLIVSSRRQRASGLATDDTIGTINMTEL